MRRVLLSFIFIFVFTLSINSTTIYVDTAGNDTTGDGSALNPFATIQRGIDASIDGDTVLVNDGEYLNDDRIYFSYPVETISFKGKSIVVTSVNGRDFTSIIPYDHYNSVEFVNGEDSNSIFDGFSILGDNYTSFITGGGIAVDNSSPIIKNCLFTGGRDGNSVITNLAKPKFYNCMFFKNDAYSIIPNLIDSTPLLSIGSNEVTVLDISSSSEVILESCLIDSNYMAVAIRCSNSIITSKNSTFSNNSVGYQNSNFGTAFYLNNSTAIIDSCTFLNNSTIGFGGVIALENNSTLQVDSSVFNGNHAFSSGGAIYCINSNVEISNSLFSNNRCGQYDNGSAIYSIETPISIINSTFAKNINENIYSPLRCCLYGLDSLSIIDNSIIANNIGGQALVSLDTLSIPNILCTNIYGNDSGDWIGNISQLADLNNNMTLDPRFCDTANNNYTLRSNSPCLSGNNSCNEQIGALGLGCSCCIGIRGNINGDIGDKINISDLVYFVAFSFQEGAEPPCVDEADVNATGTLNISDLVSLVSYMFQDGPAPAVCP